MSQAVPDFPRVLDEIGRVLKTGGWLHLLSEDYAMLRMPRSPVRAFDPDRFWIDGALAYLDSIGCDGRIGRHTPPLMEARDYTDLAMDYVIVDTLRVPRAMFGGILRAWRDGYAEALAEASERSRPRTRRLRCDDRGHRDAAPLRGLAHSGCLGTPRLTDAASIDRRRVGRETGKHNRLLPMRDREHCNKRSRASARPPGFARMIRNLFR